MKAIAIKVLVIIVTIVRINEGAMIVQAHGREYTDILTEYKVIDTIVILESEDGNTFEWYAEEGEEWGDGRKVKATMNDNGTRTREDDTILYFTPTH